MKSAPRAMGFKTVFLPMQVPVRLVTVPGSERIRIELEGAVPLGYDPSDRRLFVFGDPKRRPATPPLSDFQTRALLRQLDRHTADRLGTRPSSPVPAPAAAQRPKLETPPLRPGDAVGRDDPVRSRVRPASNVIDLGSWQRGKD